VPNLEENPLYESMRQMTKVGPETMKSWTGALEGLWSAFKEATSGAPMGSLLKAVGVNIPERELKLEQEILDVAQAGGILKPYAMGKFLTGALKSANRLLLVQPVQHVGEATMKNVPHLMHELARIPQPEYSRINELKAATGLRNLRRAEGQYYPDTAGIALDPAYAPNYTVPHEFVHARQWKPGPSLEEVTKSRALREFNDIIKWDYAERPVERHARRVAAAYSGAAPWQGESLKVLKVDPTKSFDQVYMEGLDHTLRMLESDFHYNPEVVKAVWKGVLRRLAETLPKL